ncbi:hypothetical protein OH77DRAFT_780383 [Trametes cingulata]|nr:hypothetical protein OH77DRAFT_780383 [Trametes cingulata]
MHVIFLSNDPLSSVVQDQETNRVLYEIETPFSVKVQTTTVRDARGQEVAFFKRGWTRDEVHVYGETRLVSDWLYKKKILSSSRRFDAPNGRTYSWKQGWSTSKFTLTDCETEQVVAQSHGAKSGVFSSPSKMGIEVQDEVVPILDAILVSFIILEKRRIDQLIASSSTQAANSATVALAGA